MGYLVQSCSVSETFSQIPLTIAGYKTLKIVNRLMCENLYLNHVVKKCQIKNKVNKERDRRKHQSQETEHLSRLICTVVFLK